MFSKYVVHKPVVSILLSLVFLNVSMYIIMRFFTFDCSVYLDKYIYTAFGIINLVILYAQIWAYVKHTSCVKKLPFDEISKKQGIDQIREISMQVGSKQLFEVCLDSFSCFDESDIQFQDLAQGVIVAKTFGFESIKQQGMLSNEIVQIRIESICDNKTKLILRCKPTRWFIYADFGATIIVTETILEFIREKLAEEPKINDHETKN